MSHVTCHRWRRAECFPVKLWLIYFFAEARKLGVSCCKKINQLSTSNTPKFPAFHHCNLRCLGFFGITFVQVELHLDFNNRKAGGKPARFWVNPTSLCFTQNKPPDPPDPNFKALLKKGIPRFHLEKLEFNLGDSKIPGFQDSRIGGANDPTPNPKLLRIFC